MDIEWIKTKNAENLAKAKTLRDEIVRQINGSDVLTEKDKAQITKILDDKSMEGGEFDLYATDVLLKNHPVGESYFAATDFIRSIDTREYYRAMHTTVYGGLNRYLDSSPMEFDGDIIITDPCYIIRHDKPDRSDWGVCNFGDNMKALGINHYMTRDTLYGDWGCTVYNTDTDQPIGEFCADAGLVSVFMLDEVLKYNPNFDYHKERPWTTTLIPDFKGTVQFVVEREEGVYEDDTDWWKAGDKWEDYSVHVVGHGVSKKTGEPINFRSTQTSA